MTRSSSTRRAAAPRRSTRSTSPYPPGYVRRDGAAPQEARAVPARGRVERAATLDRLDSIQIMSFSGEKVGYPTQKNEQPRRPASCAPRRARGPRARLLRRLGHHRRRRREARAALDRVRCVADRDPRARRRLLSMPEVTPFVVQRAGEAAPAGGKVGVRAVVEGRRCTLELTSFVPRGRDVPAGGARRRDALVAVDRGLVRRLGARGRAGARRGARVAGPPRAGPDGDARVPAAGASGGAGEGVRRAGGETTHAVRVVVPPRGLNRKVGRSEG